LGEVASIGRKREHMGDNVLLIEDGPAEAQALIEALADPRAGRAMSNGSHGSMRACSG